MLDRLAQLLARTRSFVHRRGLRATATLLADHARRQVWITDSHVWFALDLAEPPPIAPLPEDLQLVRGDAGQAGRVAGLDTIGPEAARERLAAGTDLWLVLDEAGAAAFACWIFRGATPVFAAHGGLLELPADVVCLEDSVTSAHHRGRGVAPAAWTRVAREVAAGGARWMITTVATDNIPSRRAVMKAGFRVFAVDRHVRRGLRRRVEVWSDGGTLGDELTRRLPGRPGADPVPEALAQRDVLPTG